MDGILRFKFPQRVTGKVIFHRRRYYHTNKIATILPAVMINSGFGALTKELKSDASRLEKDAGNWHKDRAPTARCQQGR
jgi:hypothetical protein